MLIALAVWFAGMLPTYYLMDWDEFSKIEGEWLCVLWPLVLIVAAVITTVRGFRSPRTEDDDFAAEW